MTNPLLAAAATKPATQHPKAAIQKSREGTKFAGVHLPLNTIKELKMLAIEENMTVQELHAEAIELLLAKKAHKDV